MGELFALLSAIGFSLSVVLVKKGTQIDSKNNGAFISVILTTWIAGILFIAFGFSRGWTVITQEGMIWFVVAGIFTSFLGRILLFFSIQQLGSVRATSTKMLNPFFSVILGVFLLDESVTPVLFAGMTIIFVSLIILYQDTYQGSLSKTDVARIGYLYGTASAVFYAFGYVLRKNGLMEIPDPFLGMMVGAGVGCLLFIVMALFQAKYRYIVKSSFSQFHPWFIYAGIMLSAGQILYFVALSYTDISRVALIVSIEVIFTIFLSAWVFKTSENITRKVIFASLLCVIGAGIIAVG